MISRSAANNESLARHGYTPRFIDPSTMKTNPGIYSLILPLLIAVSLPAAGQSNWENRTGLLSGSSAPVNATYGGGRFLIFSSTSTYWHSAAGTSSYSFAQLPSPPTSFTTYTSASANGRVVVTGNKNTLYSTTHSSVAGLPGTAISWTKQNPVVRPSLTPDLFCVRFLNNQFVVGTSKADSGDYVASAYSEILTSTDGEAWSSKKFPATSTGGFAYDIRDAAFKPGATPGTGTWLFTVDAGNTLLTAPEDLGSITRLGFTVNFFGTNSTTRRLIFANDLFVMARGDGKIQTSSSGAVGSWTERTLPGTPTSLRGLFHDGTTFVAVGAKSPSPTSAIYTSTDGVTWSEPTQPSTSSTTLVDVIRADGLWLALGGTRTLQTSGSSSISAASFTTQPVAAAATTGSSTTLTVTVTGAPTPTLQWLKNGTPINDGPQSGAATVSGATTSSLTLTGLTFADAASYSVQATNTAGTVTSNAAFLSISAAANGASFHPYFTANSVGGTVIPGSNPPVSVPAGVGAATFTPASGITYLPNTFVNPNTYSVVAGTNPEGSKILLGVSSGDLPLAIYDIAAQTLTQLPAVPLPLGSVASISANIPIGLADNGDVTGVIQTPIQVSPWTLNYGYHYSAASQSYRLLGNVPNAANDIASNPGGISADGTTISGYERAGIWDGPFVWTTTGGFTLLPDPANGSFANADVRGISPNARYITGFGAVHPAFGTGQTAFRWDRGATLGAPVGYALARRPNDTFADGRTVNDDGTVAGNVRQGSSSFNNNRAAVWLPDGKLVVIPDFLSATYGLATTGYTLNQITSISPDRKVLTGTATNSASQTDGFMIILPAALDASGTSQLAVRYSNAFQNSGGALTLGAQDIGTSGYSQQTAYLSNIGQATIGNISFTITGTNAADFSLATIPATAPSSLGINEFITLNPRFGPKAGSAGVRVATLTILSNDPVAPTFAINLSATANPAPEPSFSNWQALAALPQGQQGATDDPDGDGLLNLIEFVLNSEPGTSNAASFPQSTVNEGGVTYPSFSFTRRNPLTGISLTTEISTDLSFDQLLPVETVSIIDNQDGTVTVTLRSSQPVAAAYSQFFRLSAVLTP